MEPWIVAEIAACGSFALCLLLVSWGRRPDVVVDFGQQLVPARRVAEGGVMYRDVESFLGPLSVHVNALAMLALGPSLRSLLVANVLVLALASVLVRSAARAMGGPLAGFAATMTFLGIFAFGQYTGIANYDWLTPYAHEMTHGLVLAMAALACARRAAEAGSGAWIAACGLAVGASALTKPEVLLASAAAAAVGLALPPSRVDGRWDAGASGRRLAFAGAASLLPMALAWALLARPLGAARAGFVLLRPYVLVADGRISHLPMYREITGLDDLPGSLRAIALWSAVGGGLLLVLVVAALALRGSGRARRLVPAALALGVAALASAAMSPMAWMEAGRPLGLAMALSAAVMAPLTLRTRDAEERGKWAARAAWVTFGGAMLLKLGLAPQVAHYGFVLAVPAVVALVTCLVSWIPAELERRGGAGDAVRLPVLALLGVGLVAHVRLSSDHWRTRTVRVGEGADAFLADGRGRAVNDAVATLKALPEGTTVAAVPDGAMIAWLAGRRSSTPFMNLVAPEVIAYGEDSIVEAFAARPPDVIARVSNGPGAFGTFGVDYARSLTAWMAERYEPFHLSGALPDQGRGFGILLQRRKAPR